VFSLSETAIHPNAQEFTYYGSKTVILMVHGFTASPAQMRRLGSAIHQAGYTVQGMRLPGHGTTVEDMISTGWQDWLDAIRTRVLKLMESYDKIILLGLSMGGILTLLMAEELPVDGIIPISAAIKLRDRGAPFAWLFQYILPPIRGVAPKEINPDDWGYCVTPIPKVVDLMHLGRVARQNFANIHCPMLVVQGRLDETVDARAPQMILSGAVNCHDKEMLWLEQSTHVCTIGPDFDLLLRGVLDFIRRIETMDAMK
jgi:carboxylesterase